jgi:surface polysaccharide O-acyltransferase-like enzyme
MERNLSNRATTHNHGIDIVRIVAMCMVVAMHMMMRSIATTRLSCSPGARIVIRLFYVETFICVNLFVLATGWLYAGRMPKLRRIIELGLTVLFFDIGTRLVVCPALGRSFSWARLASEHWFVNAYLALILLVPFLNGGLAELNRKFGLRLVSRLVLLVSLFFGIVPISGVNTGRSLGWFVCLYLTGAQLKLSKDSIEFPSRRILLFFAVGLPVLAVFFAMIAMNFAGMSIYGIVEQYQSPVLYLSSVAYFLAFSTAYIPEPPLLIRFAASASFSVYLVHTASAIRPLFDSFSKWLVEWSSSFGAGYAVVPAVLCGVLAVYAIGMMADAFRLAVFRFLRMGSRCEAVGNWILASAFRRKPSREVF